ncbi:hypothetical protein [Aquabacterium sp. J223]|uniref:hypothetical protein n=1 Tax=Aquabacterium sp. J223 TaxID=2898431 RepID=UPI0021AE053D|nr:hypothetical protein [Aquabacterium sp. J223]UUX93964.1 hypothetical protein LRS07_11380 [Aquabacterium sp. J223]
MTPSTPSTTPSDPGTPAPLRLPERLVPLAAMAHLLERLERTPRPAGPASADQYRDLVQRLEAALADQPMDAALQALLNAHPATAELYENLQYRHAGLCRSPLEASLNAELKAVEVIGRAQRAGR